MILRATVHNSPDGCITERGMAENGSNPQRGKRTSGVTGSLIRAERLTQIAFILPCAVLVGWLAGAGLDKWLGQHWIYIAGIIVGCVAGFVQIVRLVNSQEKALEKADRTEKGQ